jgi:general secretion pathway protein G
MQKAFSLVELIIVVAILGILASIVLPQLQGNTAQAKESAAKSILATIRTQLELYKMQHNGKYPGYYGNMPVSEAFCISQFEYPTAATGHVSSSKIPGGIYVYGPYLTSFPKNPYNDLNTLFYVTTAETFAAKADGKSGWLYRRETGEICLNKSGTDSSGTAYIDY